MKCALCREDGHNRTTCSRSPRQRAVGERSRFPPAEALRLLIDPDHALVLVTRGQVAEALANATRQVGALDRDGLGHLACRDILTALAELDLRARRLPATALQRLQSTARAIEDAKTTLAVAEQAHRAAEAEVLCAIGYQAKDTTTTRSVEAVAEAKTP